MCRKTFAVEQNVEVQDELRKEPQLSHLKSSCTNEFWDKSISHHNEIIIIDDYTLSGSGFGQKKLTQLCHSQLVSVPTKE